MTVGPETRHPIHLLFCLGIFYVSCNNFLLHSVTPSYTCTVLDESKQLLLQSLDMMDHISSWLLQDWHAQHNLLSTESHATGLSVMYLN